MIVWQLATAFLNRTQNSFYKDFNFKLYDFLNSVINASGGWMDGTGIRTCNFWEVFTDYANNNLSNNLRQLHTGELSYLVSLRSLHMLSRYSQCCLGGRGYCRWKQVLHQKRQTWNQLILLQSPPWIVAVHRWKAISAYVWSELSIMLARGSSCYRGLAEYTRARHGIFICILDYRYCRRCHLF